MKILLFLFFLVSTNAFSQSLSVEKLSTCLLSKCDEKKLFAEHQFKEVYSGPRKMGGYLSLFQNKVQKEYLFSYSDKNHQITQFIYYLPTKKEYDKMSKQSVKGIKVDRKGRVEYEDGKKYYQVSISID